MKAYRRLVVATDFSAGSRAAIGAVEAVAGKTPLVVDLVHVLEPISYRTPTATLWLELDRRRREQADAAVHQFRLALQKRVPRGLRVREHVLIGAPAQVICRVAEAARADLVIVGSHGRTGFRRALLGSVAERVARSAGRPVLIVPVAGAHRPPRR